jgi:hypothetical protein
VIEVVAMFWKNVPLLGIVIDAPIKTHNLHEWPRNWARHLKALLRSWWVYRYCLAFSRLVQGGLRLHALVQAEEPYIPRLSHTFLP